MARRRRPQMTVCATCQQPVTQTGTRTYLAMHGVDRRPIPMAAPIYEHDVAPDDAHDVERVTRVDRPNRNCRCCGQPVVNRQLCPQCRLSGAHPAGTSLYIASLRCPINERVQQAQADTDEAMGIAPVLAPRMGHSAECWGTTPMNLTPEIKARCPKCSSPHSQPIQRRQAPSQAAADLAASLDYSRAPRAPRE